MIRHQIAAIIPALNEAKTIGNVVKEVSVFAIPIVVDDGSSDQTILIAKSCGADVVCHQKNEGYEAALVTGFKRAHEIGVSFVITIDADGQHDPKKIPEFYGELLNNGFDVVIGARAQFQRLAEHIFSFFGTLLWGIKDPLCGMKAYRLDHLIELINSKVVSYESVGTKFAIQNSRNGKRIKNISIRTLPRIDTPRFGVGLKANVKILISLCNVLFNG
jgi:glycosyltransferase involved in cell wall biosynthesis